MSRPLAILVAGLLLIAASPPVDAKRIRTTRVSLASTPAGATVEAQLSDGTVKTLGKTPLKRVKIPRGITTFELSLPGFLPLKHTVTVGRRRVRLTLALKPVPPKGTLIFEQPLTPDGATVSVDGKVIDPTKPFVASPGRHQVQATHPGYKPYARWVELKAATTVMMTLAMTPLAPKTGNLAIASTPSGATVWLNGEQVGVTPWFQARPPGTFALELKRDGHANVVRSATITSGATTKLDILLPIAMDRVGTLHITAIPATAEIRLDDKPVGSGTANLVGLKPGAYRVTVSAPDMPKLERTLEVVAGEVRYATLDLAARARSEKGAIRIATPHPQATVSLPGRPPQPATKDLENLAPGTYYLVLRAPGFVPRRQKTVVKAGETTELDVVLKRGAQVNVEGVIGTAQPTVHLNGHRVGKAPWCGLVEEGAVAVSLKVGKTTFATHDVVVEGGSTLKTLKAHAPVGAYTAEPLGEGGVRLSAEFGWPYPIAVGLGFGATPWLDFDLAIRSAFDVINEFELTVTAAFWQQGRWRVAADIHGGGGVGMQGRNSGFGGFGVTGTAWFGSNIALSARIGLGGYSDSLGGATIDRDSGLTLPMTLSLDVGIGGHWGLFAKFGGDPLPYTRALMNASFLTDTHVFGGVGFRAKL